MLGHASNKPLCFEPEIGLCTTVSLIDKLQATDVAT